MTGALDENGTGHIALVFEGVIVAVTATKFAESDADFSVTVHGFKEISRVQLSTKHNFFSGLETPRDKGFALMLDLDGVRYTFPPGPHARNPFLTSEAAHVAYKAVLSHLAS